MDYVMDYDRNAVTRQKWRESCHILPNMGKE